MNKHPLRPVTKEDVARFREDGAICVRNVFDREWCGRMNAAVERLLLNPGKRAREATKAGDSGRFHMNVIHVAVGSGFSRVRAALALAGTRRDASGRGPRFAVLRPGLHQGSRHAVADRLASGSAVLAGLGQRHHFALGRADAGNGRGQRRRICRRLAQMGQVLPRRHPGQGREDSATTELESCPDFSQLKGDPQYRFLSWECDAGDVICHHPLVVHGASGNASSNRRAAISVRYAGSDARWDPRPNVMKIEGEPENKLRAGDPLVLDGRVSDNMGTGARAQV